MESATQSETHNTIEICNTKLKPTTQLKSATQNETHDTIGNLLQHKNETYKTIEIYNTK
jgi:hypothetical protein